LLADILLKMLRNTILPGLMFFIAGLCCNAQVSMPVESTQDSILQFFKETASKQSEREKEAINDSISGLMERLLATPQSFDDPFTELSSMGKVYSPDKKLRVYTWNLPYADGTSRYYGFLQYLPDRNSVPLVYRLTDKSNAAESPDLSVNTKDNWYGCLVYEIFSSTIDKTDHYILLCYDPYNLFISRRIIDILYFDENSSPVFGKPVFSFRNRMVSRVIFEYSAKAQMSLHWVPEMKMIVFDHLSPSRPSYEGNYQFYGPDFSYDGFRLEEGIWKLVEDIDVRNFTE